MTVATARRLLRKYLAAFLIAAALAGCGGHPQFTDLAGNPVDFDDYRGRVVFINYWATWCHPCREEVPELNRFARDHAATAAVVGVNYDSLAQKRLAAAVAKMGIRYTVVQPDPAAALGFERPRALPVTYVLNPDGRLADTLAGAQTEKSLQAVMARLRRLGANHG